MTVDPPKPLWTPVNAEASQLSHFEKYVTDKYQVKFGIYLLIKKLR